MLIPKLLPEELLAGYRGRIRVLNDLVDTTEVHRRVNGHVGDHRPNAHCPISFSELAASMSGCSLADVVMRHTLWPFSASCEERPNSGARWSALAHSKVGRTSIMLAARPDAWMCADCIREDKEFWQFDYWRRTHQLPGSQWCCKHRTPLGRVSAAQIDAGVPSASVCSAAFAPATQIAAWQKSTIVQRYLDICSGLLDSELAIDRANCSALFKSRAIRLGFCDRGVDVPRALSEVLARSFPLDWLREVSPKINWSASRILPTLMRLFRVPSRIVATYWIALIAAMLFESADDALQALSGLKKGVQVGEVSSPTSIE